MNDMEFRQWLASRLDRLETKQDVQTAKQAEMTAHLDRNTASLEVHIAGVNAVNKRVDQVQAQIEPVIGVIRFGSFALKVFIGLGTMGSAVYGVVKLVSIIN